MATCGRAQNREQRSTYPEDHNCRNKDTRSRPSENNVGDRFKDRVGNEEDGQRGVVLTVGHPEIFLQAIELCVPDIGPIQERTQIEQ